jgi:hypothetical protein
MLCRKIGQPTYLAKSFKLVLNRFYPGFLFCCLASATALAQSQQVYGMPCAPCAYPLSGIYGVPAYGYSVPAYGYTAPYAGIPYPWQPAADTAGMLGMPGSAGTIGNTVARPPLGIAYPRPMVQPRHSAPAWRQPTANLPWRGR